MLLPEKNQDLDLFEWKGSINDGEWMFKEEYLEKLHLNNEANICKVEVLKNIIGQRDYTYNGEKIIKELKSFEEGQDYKFFATLALTLVAQAYEILSQPNSDTATAANYSLKAMEAVCYADCLYDLWYETQEISDQDRKNHEVKFMQLETQYQIELENQKELVLEGEKLKLSERMKKTAEKRYAGSKNTKFKEEVLLNFSNSMYLGKADCARRESKRGNLTEGAILRWLEGVPDPRKSGKSK